MTAMTIKGMTIAEPFLNAFSNLCLMPSQLNGQDVAVIAAYQTDTKVWISLQWP